MGTIYQWKVYKKNTVPVITGVSVGEGLDLRAELLSASLFSGVIISSSQTRSISWRRSLKFGSAVMLILVSHACLFQIT